MSAVTGTSTERAILATASSIRSTGAVGSSGTPRDAAIAALDVPTARAPATTTCWALATSQALTSTSGLPGWCSERSWAARSIGRLLSGCLSGAPQNGHRGEDADDIEAGGHQGATVESVGE